MPSDPIMLPMLPGGRIAAVKNAILQSLADDTILVQANLKVTSYKDGRDESDKVKPEPDETELPYLRLMYGNGNLAWENERQHKITIPINFHLFTKRSNEDDMTNLGEAVIQALFPQDPGRRAVVFDRFREIPGMNRSSFKGANAFGNIGYSNHGLKSTWTLQVILTIDT